MERILGAGGVDTRIVVHDGLRTRIVLLFDCLWGKEMRVGSILSLSRLRLQQPTPQRVIEPCELDSRVPKASWGVEADHSVCIYIYMHAIYIH